MSDANKAIITRLINEVLGDGLLDVIDELYAPELAPTANAGSPRFESPSQTCVWRSSS